MATVTGYTAEKTEEIMGEQIVSGAVVGNNLILTKRNDGTINAGNVRGPVGETGGVSEAAMETAIEEAIGISGKGVIAIEQTQDDIEGIGGLDPGTWKDVAGMSVTFTPVTGRNLRASFQVQVSSQDSAGDTQLAARIIRTGGLAICNDNGFVEGSLPIVMGGQRVMVVPAWGGAQTFKMQIKTDGSFAMDVVATDVVCYMSFEDLGEGFV